jgi:hypothetical protein
MPTVDFFKVFILFSPKFGFELGLASDACALGMPT